MINFFDDLISDLAKILKEQGFSKSVSTFFLKSENVGVINIQKSRGNIATSIKFTINMGIYSPKLANVLPYNKLTDKPDIPRCHWRARIGGFLPDNTDFWWTIELNADSDEIKKDIMAKMTQIVIPNIKKRIDEEALLDAWLNDSSSGLTEYELHQNVSTLLKLLGKAQEYDLYVKKLGEMRKSKSLEVLLKEHLEFLDGLPIL